MAITRVRDLGQRDWRVLKACRTKRPRPAARALPIHVVGAAPLTTSNEPMNLIPGLKQRFAARVPKPVPALMRGLRKFVWAWCCRYLTPYIISPDFKFSFDAWLDRSSYTGAEKTRLRNLYEKRHMRDGVLPRRLSARQTRVNVFVKKQWWDKYKHLRWIMPRSDEYKIQFGPVISVVEHIIYAIRMGDLPVFIKLVPVAQRPEAIEALRKLGSLFAATDHSRFEAHINAEVQNAVEFTVYEFLCRRNAYAREMIHRLKVLQTGEQRILGPGFALTIGARRMSGDVTTSIGNGLTNLLIFLYAMQVKGIHARGYVEGDDGIFALSAESNFTVPDPDYFAQFGMELKIEVVDEVNLASFCGNVYDPTSLRNVTDPIQKILRIGWTLHDNYFGARQSKLLGLQRAAALSLAVGYEGCPILCEYARFLLRATRGALPRFGEGRHKYTWEEIFEMGGDDWKTTTKARVTSGPREADRTLVERVYGIVRQDQIELERYFSGLSSAAPWTHPLFDKYCPQINKDAWRQQSCGRVVDWLVYPKHDYVRMSS